MRKIETNPRLWIIDDESEFSAGLTSALMRQYEIETFKNPGEVLFLLKGKSSPPDAIVTDLRMPRIDGLEMVRRLREMNYEIPVVLASGGSERENIAAALNLGVRFFFEKPFPIVELKSLLEQIIAEETQRKALEERATRLEQLIVYQNQLMEVFAQRQISTKKFLTQLQTPYDADLTNEIESRPEYSDSIKKEILLRAHIQKLSAEGPFELRGKRIQIEQDRTKKNGTANSAT